MITVSWLVSLKAITSTIATVSLTATVTDVTLLVVILARTSVYAAVLLLKLIHTPLVVPVTVVLRDALLSSLALLLTAWIPLLIAQLSSLVA